MALEEERNMLQQEKLGKQRSVGNQKKMKQRNAKAALKTFRVVDGENHSSRDRV